LDLPPSRRIESRGTQPRRREQYTVFMRALIVVTFSEEQIKKWKEDPASFFEFRREIEHEQHMSYTALIQGTNDQVNGQAFFSDMMKNKLATKPEIYEQLLPSFPPGCRRLTPGPGYLEALVEPNVYPCKEFLIIGRLH